MHECVFARIWGPGSPLLTMSYSIYPVSCLADVFRQAWGIWMTLKKMTKSREKTILYATSCLLRYHLTFNFQVSWQPAELWFEVEFCVYWQLSQCPNWEKVSTSPMLQKTDLTEIPGEQGGGRMLQEALPAAPGATRSQTILSQRVDSHQNRVCI